MSESSLEALAAGHLKTLCLDMPDRSVGRPSNRKATDYFQRTVTGLGWRAEQQGFDCLAWESHPVSLEAGGRSFEAFPSPYTLGCLCTAPLRTAATVGELERGEFEGCLLLLTGDLAKEQLMPKGFIFYNPEEHQAIIRLLEAKRPAAVIGATGRDPLLAGGMYPFPLIEDGDFDIPAVYMTDTEGERLASFAGSEAALAFRSERIPSSGCNVLARKGRSFSRRLVVSAHIDAKENTPGALDNGSGVTVLLLLARLLADYDGEAGVELLALNGEDYYAASGQMTYLSRNKDRFAEIALAVNLDGVGYREGVTEYSFYGLAPGPQQRIRSRMKRFPGMAEGQPWPQGDHMLFAMNGRPAMAMTSRGLISSPSQSITHTPRDAPDLVDCSKLAVAAMALAGLAGDFSKILG